MSFDLFKSMFALGVTAYILGTITGIVIQIAISELLDELDRDELEENHDETYLHIIR